MVRHDMTICGNIIESAVKHHNPYPCSYGLFSLWKIDFMYRKVEGKLQIGETGTKGSQFA